MNLDDYPIFNKFKTTLKETSKDYSDKNNPQFMTESELKVINFDDVKTEYTRNLGISNECAASVDALLQDKNSIVFIEFKNGEIGKAERNNIRNKVAESLLVFLDVIGKDLEFSRENTEFILVYNRTTANANKIKAEEVQLEKRQLQSSPSWVDIVGSVSKRANIKPAYFGVNKFKKIFFREVHTYDKDEFDRYIAKYRAD